MTFDHRPDSDRSPYAQQLDDQILDAAEEEAWLEFERRLELARYRVREAASSAAEHEPPGPCGSEETDDAA